MSKFHQGLYKAKNTSKYKGNSKNIIFRSSWELKAFYYLDNNPKVLEWAAEEIFIPYVHPGDGKIHRYFIDLWCSYEDKDGNIKKALIEIKPHAETQQPVKPTRLTESYKKKVYTYLVNQAKWDAAIKFCAKHNIEFKIWTEKTLKNLK